MKQLTTLVLIAALVLSLSVSAFASEDLRAQIEGLPTVEAFKAMDSAAQDDAYLRTQNAYDAYMALTEEERAQLEGAEETFEALFGYYNTLIAYADEEEPSKTNGRPLALAVLLAVPILVYRRKKKA